MPVIALHLVDSSLTGFQAVRQQPLWATALVCREWRTVFRFGHDGADERPAEGAKSRGRDPEVQRRGRSVAGHVARTHETDGVKITWTGRHGCDVCACSENRRGGCTVHRRCAREDDETRDGWRRKLRENACRPYLYMSSRPDNSLRNVRVPFRGVMSPNFTTTTYRKYIAPRLIVFSFSDATTSQ